VSGYQPIGIEALYSSYQAGTVSVPTAAAVTITAGHPPVVIPAGYLKTLGNWSSGLRLFIAGQMTATVTIPSWNIGIYASVATTSAPAFSSAGILVGSTGTFTPPSAVTSVQFIADLHIGLRTLATGAASTVVCFGTVQSTGVNAAGEVTLPAAGAYTPPATWDTTQAYVLWPALTLSAATAGNTMQVHVMKLYGEN
jgi:hypothetical protein